MPKVDENSVSVAMEKEKQKKIVAMKKAMAKVEKDLGARVALLSDKFLEKVDVIPTGVMSIDRALQVFGFPRRRIVELFGEPGAGKTMLGLLAIGVCQKNGGVAGLIDMECAYDKDFGKMLGVNNDELFFTQPEYAEQALEIADSMISANHLDLLVLDSVAALVPKAELEGSMEDQQIGLMARIMGKGLRKLTRTISYTNTCMIFINQVRMKVGVLYGNPEVTPGGKALEFYASQRVRITSGPKIKEGDEVVGHTARVAVVKNKVGPPFGKGEVVINYRTGIDIIKDVCEVAKAEGIIGGSHAWVNYTSDKFKADDGSKEFKTQGLPNFIEGVRTVPGLSEEIRDKIVAKIEADRKAYQEKRNVGVEIQQEANKAGIDLKNEEG